jgi:hypothetical protein
MVTASRPFVLIISSARLFAATHTARCANTFAQGEAAREESLDVGGDVNIRKEFCPSLAAAEKDSRAMGAVQASSSATITVRGADTIQAFLNTILSVVKFT